MHSTKSIGFLIIFLLSTSLFHFLFKIKSGASGAALWLASAAFGAIVVYLLHMCSQDHKTHATE